MASGGRRLKPRLKAKKRTKYLSLKRLIIKAEEVPMPPPPREEEEVATPTPGEEEDGDCSAQNLFAALPAPSLPDILGAAASPPPQSSASPDDDGVSGGGAAGFPGGGAVKEEEGELVLARRALRGREHSTCSSSSPCSSAPRMSDTDASARARALLLNLDYQEILAAWADRGSLYIGHAAAAAPRMSDRDASARAHALLLNLDYQEILAAWADRGSLYIGQHAAEPGRQDPQPAVAVAATTCAPGTVACKRAESVRRYKEKRRTRLFGPRIRYEVRRVNAAKKPRFKGRFLKKHEAIEVQPA